MQCILKFPKKFTVALGTTERKISREGPQLYIFVGGINKLYRYVNQIFRVRPGNCSNSEKRPGGSDVGLGLLSLWPIIFS